MITLYDAARCPYCARVRIVLAEKGVAYEPVEIDLRDRPRGSTRRTPPASVPVLEEDGWVLPESAVINEYLEERYPEPPLWPDDPGERAAGAAARLPLRRLLEALLRVPARRGRRARALRRGARLPRRAARRAAVALGARVRARRRRVPPVAGAARDMLGHPARAVAGARAWLDARVRAAVGRGRARAGRSRRC